MLNFCIFLQSKSQLEKSKQTLEAENADLAAELKSSASSKSELERKRKFAESQLSEYLIKIIFCVIYTSMVFMNCFFFCR